MPHDGPWGDGMCGIAGFEAHGSTDPEIAETLLAHLAPRGPDGAWHRRVGAWELVQTRLSVIDLSPSVRYPMPNETNDVWLLFNGEVYNHLDLRRHLERLGHRFRTRCDAEVVVHGWEEWGPAVFRKLSGMWAIALCDVRTNEVVLARDARGVKPLVWTAGSRFAFSSDAMALVGAGLSIGEVDPDAIAEFGAFHYVPPPGTGLRDVEQVPAGSYLRRSADGRVTIDAWAPSVFDGAPSESVTDQEADAAIQRAVDRQLQADVPVGIFLSGGVDSALVLDCAAKSHKSPVAFTIGFEGAGDYDETNAARDLARALGVEHHVHVLRPRFGDTIEAVASAFDTPFADPSAIATLPLARLARSHVTVALSGTGGDDLFAGYYRHRAIRLRRPFAALPTRLRRLAYGGGAFRGSERRTGLALATSYARRLAMSAGEDDRAFYLDLVGRSTSDDVAELFASGGALADARCSLAERNSLASGAQLSLAQIQEFELDTYLSGDLLVKEDRATMASGLEGRVPLLDEEVTLLAARTPEAQRAGLLAGKVLLRRIARQRLGRRVSATRKRGFAVPLGLFLQRGWREDALDWISSEPSVLLDTRQAHRLLSIRQRAPLDVWAVCALLAWERRLSRVRASSVPPRTSSARTPGST